MEALKQLNLYDDSLVLLTSDHGEEFWEHNGFEHGHTLYNEVLWVPLMIKLPMSAARGQVETAVSTLSVTPTVLDLCGIDYDRRHLSAGSLSDLWESSPDGFDEPPIVSTGLLYYENRESVILDGLKYIHFLLSDREELYDLARDAGEQVSILKASPEKAERAREALREHQMAARKLQEYYGIFETEKLELDREAIRILRSIGYVQ
jgi:arylsulfatase A-like enzyme